MQTISILSRNSKPMHEAVVVGTSFVFKDNAIRRSFSLFNVSGKNREIATPKNAISFNMCRKIAATKINPSAVGDQPKFLQLNNINPNFVEMEYAVRGPLVVRAGEIEKELKHGANKPFDYVIRANIGDCQAMGQKPNTFLRQLLNLTFCPELLDCTEYPDDVKDRAEEILEACQGGSAGSYTDSAGLEVVRRQVANYIERRDCINCDWRNVYLTAGATSGIKRILSLLNCEVNGKKPAVMVPIPQYPLYSATISEYGMEKIGYYLEEETGWSLNPQELNRAVNESNKNIVARAIVVINPGNPTGQVLTHNNIEEIIKFAYTNKLLIMADEVYQPNIYDEKSQFFSFKKVMHDMGYPYNGMELVSFMSASKGFLGECGLRGGYYEIINVCPDVKAMLWKSITASLCSTTAGQVAVSALVNPPDESEPSYEQYTNERDDVLASLRERAELMYEILRKFEGFQVNPIQGAMYVFPKIDIPPKAAAAAKAKNMPADTFYAAELLENTGVCVVPGSGFGQKPFTNHFRSTILPQIPLLKEMMTRFKKFHTDFMKKYK
uniref:alanine transaminase n=1 Tax=Glossina morsitans morsitans TaxID=37546 RepID=A0A1B0FKH6_GLOMM